jgi:hypothetical protein
MNNKNKIPHLTAYIENRLSSAWKKSIEANACASGLIFPPDSHWLRLNGAAKANLNDRKLSEFFRYRNQLEADGHAWEGDAEDILTGFIWDGLERMEQYD